MLFLPTYRDKRQGGRKASAVWWWEFGVAGKRYVESSRTRDRAQAAALEAARIAEVQRTLGIGEFGAEENRRVLIGDEVFLYKEKAPFVPSGCSVSGALEYDAASESIKCHECGEWHSALCHHIGRRHGLTAREYKQRHGLRQGTALISEELRARKVVIGQKLHAAGVIGGTFGLDRHTPSPGLRRGLMMEMRNRIGRCHAQVLETMRELAARLGTRSLTQSELMTVGLHARSISFLFGLPLREVQILAGLEPPAPGVRLGKHRGGRPRSVLSKQVLIELLIDFWVRFKRLPSGSDWRRGFLPAKSQFCAQFGNWGNACEKAGLARPLAGRGRTAA